MACKQGGCLLGLPLIIACLVISCPIQAADESASARPDFLAAYLDTNVDPGADFFQYANGTWLRRNPIPAGESIYGIGTLVRDQLFETLRTIHEQAAAGQAADGSELQKIGDYWHAAMDADGAAKTGKHPLDAELARIESARDRAQVVDVAFALIPLGVRSFFLLTVEQDEIDSATNSIHVYQGGLGLPDRDFYLKSDPSLAKIRAAYREHIAQTLQLLGRPESAARDAAAGILRFETELAKASRPIEDTRDPERNYTRVAPADLKRLHTRSIDWTASLARWNLSPDYVAVAQPEFLDGLDAALRRTPVAVLQDYLRFHLISTYAEFLGGKFDDENFDFFQRRLNGAKEPLPRWKRVLIAENDGFFRVNPVAMLVGRRYVEAHFSEAVKARYASMVQAIIDAYAERIRHLDWMSEGTRERALRKLAMMGRKVGFPDRWPDSSTLRIESASYAANRVAIERWRFQHMVERFGRPVDRDEWLMTPQTYNAYYNPSNNEIVLPAAQFVIPGVEDNEIDDAVAYGYTAASTIGHEITHGFDDAGRKYDEAGNLKDWWTAEDAARFEERAHSVVAQFDAYEPLPGFHINGQASLGENIADLGGVVLGLDAFRKTEQFRSGEKIGGLAPMQRFFVGYGLSWLTEIREERLRKSLLSDVHAPARWRVIGPLSDVPEFYDSFGVHEGQAMWRAPGQRARVW